jgi:hypothetical protein
MRGLDLALALLVGTSACANSATTSTHQASAVTDLSLAEEAPPPEGSAANPELDFEAEKAAELDEALDALASSLTQPTSVEATLSGRSPKPQLGELDGVASTGVGGVGASPGTTTPTGGSNLALGPPTVRGGLDRAAVQRVFDRKAPRLRLCFHRQLTTSPQLAGSLDVSVTIGAQGEVTASKSHGGTLQSPEVERCVLSKLKKMAFDKPSSGAASVDVQLRFT